MDFPIPIPQLLIANVIIAVGALLQGSVGFGLGMLSAPLLIHIHPDIVPGPLIGSALLLTVLMALQEHSGIDVRGLAWALPGRFSGAAIAALTLTALPGHLVSIVFAGLILFVVALSASGLHLRPTRRSLLGAGLVSGITGTITSVGGPPIALVYQAESGPRLRGTLAGYFTFGASSSLIALACIDRFGPKEIMMSVSMMPGVLVGFWASRFTKHHLDKGHTRRAVLAVSTLAAALVIIRTFFN